MAFYRVTIDGEIYEGAYGTQPDAVNGAMIKQMNDKRARLPNYSDLQSARWSETDYRKAHEDHTQWAKSPKLIGVETLESRHRKHPKHKAKFVGRIDDSRSRI